MNLHRGLPFSKAFVAVMRRFVSRAYFLLSALSSLVPGGSAILFLHSRIADFPKLLILVASLSRSDLSGLGIDLYSDVMADATRLKFLR